jgi:hypothetical protein
MLAVEQLIGDLLLKHNCVIVPAFGGFVASQTSAQIDYMRGTMLPPKKSLLFNRQLINNDGLLVAELASESAVSFDQAHRTVAELVHHWNEKLKRGERVHLDRIGHLYLDAERNICFEQDRFFNLLLESYGLGKVQFIPEIEEKSSETAIEAKVLTVDFGQIEQDQARAELPIIPHPETVKRTKVWRYVAAACLLPIAFYSFWIPMKTDVLESGMLSVKDFNPFYKSSEGTYVPVEKALKGLDPEQETIEETVARIPQEVEVFSYRFDDDLYIPVRIKSNDNHTTLAAEPMNTPSNVGLGQGGRYKVIVGCFSDVANAENLVKKLRAEGFDSRLAGVAGGLTRVSAGSADSAEQLQTLNALVAEKGYSGWVLK